MVLNFSKRRGHFLISDLSNSLKSQNFKHSLNTSFGIKYNELWCV